MASAAFNPFEMAQQQFDSVARQMSLDQASCELLRRPMREFHFSIPLRLDDGSVSVLQGFRVQHCDARGPCAGGIRFHPQETIDAVRALAMWMSWKCAVVDLPLGGACGGVVCDPHNLSMAEQERLCRGWVRQVGRNIGPLADVPAPDVMTNAQHMLWLLDEYENIASGRYPGAFTGKPSDMGGSLGRTEATGYGVVYTVREALKELGLRPDETLAAVQGFGTVARHAIALLDQLGVHVIAVSCWDQQAQRPVTYRNADGISHEQLAPITDRFGGIDQGKARDLGYEVLDGGAWLEQEVDLLLPAALENQINSDNVGRLGKRLKLIAEGANGPTTPDADARLRERGVFVIPDLLASAGGVTTSYFEQVQSNMNYYWSKDEVLGKLDWKMTSAYIAVSELATRRKIPLREAAYLIAVGRVATACRDRGWV